MNSNSQNKTLKSFEEFDISPQKVHKVVGGRRKKKKKKKNDHYYEIISDGAFF